MPKITSAEPQKKNPHRFNIFLDGQFAFGADEDLVVDYRLISGKQLTTSDVEQLLFEAHVGKLMDRMYRLFNIRQRSEKEVRDYFRIKNYELRIKSREQISDLAIELVIKKLKQKRLLNDEEFAKSWMEVRSKKKGIRVIKGELFKKGIDRDIIEEITEDEGLGFKQQDTAEQLLLKRLPRWKNLDRIKKKQKAYEFLLRHGFEYDILIEVIEKLLKKEYNNSQ